MTKLLKLIAITFLTLFATTQAFAEVDIRGNFNYATFSSSDLDAILKANFGSSYPKHTSMIGFGGDAVYYFPMRLGLGGRYETWSDKVSGGGTDNTVNANRGAFLVGYRFVNMGPYLGLVGTYGVSHDVKVKTSGSNDLSTVSQQSYTFGVEGGIKINHFMIGSEVGYQSFVCKDIQQNSAGTLTSVTINGNKSNLDLSGLYAKVQVGVNF